MYFVSSGLDVVLSLPYSCYNNLPRWALRFTNGNTKNHPSVSLLLPLKLPQTLSVVASSQSHPVTTVHKHDRKKIPCVITILLVSILDKHWGRPRTNNPLLFFKYRSTLGMFSHFLFALRMLLPRISAYFHCATHCISDWLIYCNVSLRTATTE